MIASQIVKFKFYNCNLRAIFHRDNDMPYNFQNRSVYFYVWWTNYDILFLAWNSWHKAHIIDSTKYFEHILNGDLIQIFRIFTYIFFTNYKMTFMNINICMIQRPKTIASRWNESWKHYTFVYINLDYTFVKRL